VLTGTGEFLLTDPVLGNNDAILWTTYGSATIPLDLYTDTISVGGGGVNGDLAIIRGSDDVVMISLDGSGGHIVAASITTPGLTTLAGDVLSLQGAMLTATTANTAQGSAIAANAGSHTALATSHATLDTAHTVTLASLATTHALTLGHASYITAHAAAGNPHGVSAVTVGLGSCDNTADADKPISTAGAAANAVLLATGNAHVADATNPHAVSPAQLGLGNVTNTSDLAKPVSTAQQAAIDVLALYRTAVVFRTSAVLPGATSYDPAAGTIALVSAGELNNPGIGHTMAVGDRLLVAQQTDTRENGVYVVTSLGSNAAPYALTAPPRHSWEGWP
jgi:hypothetical protein